MTTDDTNLARARAAWGEAIPAWVEVLAEECDRTSQARAGDRIGRSAGLVCNTLKGCYTGDLKAVEQLVRGALMAETVACPVVGELATDTCLSHQRAPWAPHNPSRIRFYRACRGVCPHSRVRGAPL